VTKYDIDPPHSQDARSTLQWVEIPMFAGPSAKSVVIQTVGSPLQSVDDSHRFDVRGCVAGGVVAITEFSMQRLASPERVQSIGGS
jgi:hypothetical protein